WLATSLTTGGRDAVVLLLAPGNRSMILRRLEVLQVRHHLPDRVGREDPAERGHASGPAVEDRVKHHGVRAAVAPAAVGQARTHRPHRPASMTAVAVERGEEFLALFRRLLVSLERIVELARGRSSAAREDVLLVEHGGGRRLLGRAHQECEERRRRYSANSHTMPPRLVCRAMSGMKPAG